MPAYEALPTFGCFEGNLTDDYRIPAANAANLVQCHSGSTGGGDGRRGRGASLTGTSGLESCPEREKSLSTYPVV